MSTLSTWQPRSCPPTASTLTTANVVIGHVCASIGQRRCRSARAAADTTTAPAVHDPINPDGQPHAPDGPDRINVDQYTHKSSRATTWTVVNVDAKVERAPVPPGSPGNRESPA